MFDKVIRMGVGLLVGVWVARYLGPDRFGLLNYSTAFTALFGAFATLGLDSIVIRNLVKFPDQINDILGSAFILKLLGAIFAFMLVMLSLNASRNSDQLTHVLVAIAASGFFFQSFYVIDFYFQSQVKSKYTIYATNASFLLMTGVRIFLLLNNGTLEAFAWTALAEIALSAIFLISIFRKLSLSPFSWRCHLSTMRTLIRASWPLMLSGVSIMIAMRIDQIMIGQLLNNGAVGVYSAAARISEIWYFIPLSISSSVFPLLIESKRLDEALYEKRLQRLYDFLILTASAFAIVITFFSAVIVRLLYGPSYADSAGILVILIWSGLPVSFGCGWSNWMLIENRTKMIFAFQVNAAVFNIILNAVLIPHFGIKGSAYATLISYSLGHTVLAALIKSQHKALNMLARAFFPVGILADWKKYRKWI